MTCYCESKIHSRVSETACFLLFLGDCHSKGRCYGLDNHSHLKTGLGENPTYDCNQMLGKLPAESKTSPFLKNKFLLSLIRATETTHQHLHTQILSKTTFCTSKLKMPNPGQRQLMQGREQREGKGYTREALLFLGKGPWRRLEHVSYAVTEFKQDLNLTLLSIIFS